MQANMLLKHLSDLAGEGVLSRLKIQIGEVWPITQGNVVFWRCFKMQMEVYENVYVWTNNSRERFSQEGNL